jgi:hypothetical protein
MPRTSAVIAAVAALVLAGCARRAPVIVSDPPLLGGLTVDVVQEAGRVSFRAHRTLEGAWAPGTRTQRAILEARVARPGQRPFWQVRTSDPQAAVVVLPYAETPPGYARDIPASRTAPGLERGKRYEVWVRDAGGWSRAEFVYAPEARVP